MRARLREPSNSIQVFRIGILLIIILFWQVCSNDYSTKYNENLPPETSLFICSTDTLNPTKSVQVISWDGRDPDGFVIGFYYRWISDIDSSDWTYTKAYCDTFALAISGERAYYTFYVKAMDNDSLTDSTPATQLIPIKNTVPEISWTINSQIPDTTFTVASFNWTATDIDGDSTITYFEWALDDTTEWTQISGVLRTVTIDAADGLTQGDHCFYLKAIDVAGGTSDIIRMPDNPANFWYVKEPINGYLLVDDHNSETSTLGLPDKYYKGMLTDVIGDFNYWNIEKLFPASINQFTETLKLFDRVIWYTDLVVETDKHFIAAQVAIPEVLKAGGKVIYICQFNTGFGVQGDPLAFTPVDSLDYYYGRIFPPANLIPQDGIKAVLADTSQNLPELKMTSGNIFGAYSVDPKDGSIVLYRYDERVFVVLGRNDNTGEYDMVFSGMPLHQINGDNNLNEFFEILLNDVFK